MNQVMITGNLGEDPILRETDSDTPVVNFSVANNEHARDKDGNPFQRTFWFKVVLFGRTAENAAKYLKKGSKVLVRGTLQNNVYTDSRGVTHHKVQVFGHEVDYLSSRDQVEEADTVEQDKDVKQKKAA